MRDRIKELLGRPMWFDRWVYRIQQILLIGFVVVVALGTALSAGDKHWPYEVLERKLLTPTTTPGGPVAMHRVIEYHNADCWRAYDRRAVSKAAEGRMYRFDKVIDEKLPVELSGLPQSWSENLPSDFPCGSAYLVETITAACTWWQRHFAKLTKNDVITPFTVTGCK